LHKAYQNGIPKIQLTGDSTYVISLPKVWIKNNKINKGDVLSVVARGEEITFRIKEEKERAAEIKIRTKDAEFLTRLLITKYIQGFDTITLSSKDRMDLKIREHLIKTSTHLIGLEHFGETRDTITFRMLMKGGRDFRESMERMHDLSILSLKELLDELENQQFNESLLNGIIQRDNDIDKFYFLVLRQLSIIGGYESIIWAQVAKSIERISDHIETIAELTLEGNRIEKDDALFYRQLIELYGDAMLTLKNIDLQTAEDILTRVEKIRSQNTEMKTKQGGKGNNILIYASFRRISEYLADMAESAINLS